MRKYWHAPNKVLFLITCGLVVFGVIMIYNASAIMAERRFGDSTLFLKKQFLWATMGLFIMIAVSKIDYNLWQRLSPSILITAFFLLVGVLIFGKQISGARRWLRVGFLNFQPSELAKIAMIIYLARSLDKKRGKIKDFKVGVLPQLIVLGVFCVLILLEPDFGGAIILAGVGFIMFFMGGIKLLHFSYLGLGMIPFLFIFIIKAAYRKRRILSFLNPWADPQSKGYQIIQSLLAFGAGGLFGRGLGNSQQKLFHLPEPHTDFIFPIIGEEWGLLGTLIIIFVFIVFAWQGRKISLKAPNLFGCLLAAGITFLITFQAILNIAVVTACLPTKGLPLPFLSFGGSSLIFNLIGVGILLNISRQTKY
ncbi:putative lipid II flippase FtsW [bacterium]|nr:putative lipid II flippase FtsW [bacterium]